jgi:hypothetical protein
MLKYCVSAAALKVFSSSSVSRRLYRRIGNSIGGRKRALGVMPGYYFERVENMLRIADRYGVPKDGDRIVELGTGWLHWEAITARLFFDVHGTLMDVWDNRHLRGLQNYLAQLDPMLDRLPISATRRHSARGLIARICQATDFASLYGPLGFEYTVDPDGTLAALDANSYDLVVSGGVLEHVSARHADDFTKAIAARLRPGGYSVHSINIRDHLYQYDTTVSPKNYLRYSNRAWRMLFENDVQYINKLQRSEWLALFRDAGLVLIEEQTALDDLTGLKIAEDFRHLSDVDLRCGNLRIVHRRPG